MEIPPIYEILVKAKSPRGRWRAGLHFPREGRKITEADGLTVEQLRQIKDDPELIASQVPAAEISAAQARAIADKANAEALAREKAATKKPADKKAWEEAAAAVQLASELDDAAWAALAPAARVHAIEAELAKATK